MRRAHASRGLECRSVASLILLALALVATWLPADSASSFAAPPAADDPSFFDLLFAQQLAAGIAAGLVTGVIVGLIVLAAQGGVERRNTWNRVALEVAVLWEAVLEASAEPNAFVMQAPADVLRLPAKSVTTAAEGKPLTYWHDVLVDDERLHVIELFTRRRREFDIAARRFDLFARNAIRRANAAAGIGSAWDEDDVRYVAARLRGAAPSDIEPFIGGSAVDAERRSAHLRALEKLDDAKAFVAADREIQDAIDLLISIAQDDDPRMDPRSHKRPRHERLVETMWFFEPCRTLLSWFATRRVKE